MIVVNSYTSFPGGPAELYVWSVSTTYTFTNNGATGANAMTSLPIYGGPFYPAFISMPVNGYQYLTIGGTGNYQITANGCKGLNSANGTGGSGGGVRGTISLSVGDVLILCVGQVGLNGGGISGSGGSGMTAVFLLSGGIGTPIPLLVGAGGGGAAGPGTGSPPTDYTGFGPTSSFDDESTASALQGTDRSAGSAVQFSIATAFSNATFSFGLISSGGSNLTGRGSTNLSGNAGGWPSAGCGGGGAGNGGGGGGWRGSNNTPAKTGGSAGTNFIRSTLTSRSFVGFNTGTGSITITRVS